MEEWNKGGPDDFGSRLEGWKREKKIFKEIGLQDLSFHSPHAHHPPIVQQESGVIQCYALERP